MERKWTEDLNGSQKQKPLHPPTRQRKKMAACEPKVAFYGGVVAISSEVHERLQVLNGFLYKRRRKKMYSTATFRNSRSWRSYDQRIKGNQQWRMPWPLLTVGPLQPPATKTLSPTPNMPWLWQGLLHPCFSAESTLLIDEKRVEVYNHWTPQKAKYNQPSMLKSVRNGKDQRAHSPARLLQAGEPRWAEALSQPQSKGMGWLGAPL